MNKERKIIVAINYNGCNINEALDIIYEYVNTKNVNIHNIDESKNYIDLRYFNNEVWESFVSDWCEGNGITESGLFFEKYDDWKLCSLPIGWEN